MQWFEDDRLWADMYPFMFPEERVNAAEDDVKNILALAQVSHGRVLDLCCGPGRHAVAFARHGFDVVGVDRTPFLLDRARERAGQAAMAVEWVMEDMRSFVRPQAFDLACNLFTSFGYFEQEAENQKVLRNVYESLTDAGVFVMEMLGKERLARVLQSAICTEYPDGSLWIQRPHILDGWMRLRNDWTIIIDGRVRSFQLEHDIYSGRELHDRLRSAGFREVRLYGDLTGAPYGVDAARLVAVARK